MGVILGRAPYWPLTSERGRDAATVRRFADRVQCRPSRPSNGPRSTDMLSSAHFSELRFVPDRFRVRLRRARRKFALATANKPAMQGIVDVITAPGREAVSQGNFHVRAAPAPIVMSTVTRTHGFPSLRLDRSTPVRRGERFEVPIFFMPPAAEASRPCSGKLSRRGRLDRGRPSASSRCQHCTGAGLHPPPSGAPCPAVLAALCGLPGAGRLASFTRLGDAVLPRGQLRRHDAGHGASVAPVRRS